MPTVPTYGSRRVATAPLPNARRQAAETPESLGAGVGEAQARFGEQIGRVATGPLQDIIREERARADQVADLTVLRRFNQLDQQVLHDPDRGYLNTRGMAALETRDEAFRVWDEGADQIGANTRNPGQKLFFEQQRVQRRAQLEDQANQHLVTERHRHDAAETTAFLETTGNRITVNADQPHIVAGAIAEQEAAIQDYAGRNGLGAYEAAQLREKTVNASWSSAITQSLAAGNPRLAQAYFTRATASGQLTGSAMTQMQTAVAAGIADQEGETGATDIWRTMGPKDQADPVKLFDMHEQARARFPNDPAARQAAIDGLTRRKAAWDAQITAQDAATTSTLGKMVLELVPPGALPAQIRSAYERIRQTPAYIAAPTKIQGDIRDTLENEAIRADNRLYTAEARASAAEQRQVTALTRRQLELEINGWGEAWRLQQDPVAFSKMTYSEIVGKAKTLGVAHVTRLLEAHQQLQNAAARSTAAIDADQFKAIAYKNGVSFAYKTPGDLTPEEAANAGRLLDTVQREIARQEGSGAKLSYEQKGALMQKVLDQKVTVDHGWWYGQHEVSRALVANPEDQAAARVPITAIPPQHLTDSINQMRAVRPWLQRKTDDEIRTQFQRALERAYAAYLLGLGDEEIQKRLLETP